VTFSADDLDESNARQIELHGLLKVRSNDCPHTRAVDSGECTFGCCDKFFCPDCGKNVFVEIPR